MKTYFMRFANVLFILGTLSGGLTAVFLELDWHVPFVYACFVVPSVIINYMVHGCFIMWNKKTYF